MDHTRAGSMVVTESEWTYGHRHRHDGGNTQMGVMGRQTGRGGEGFLRYGGRLASKLVTCDCGLRKQLYAIPAIILSGVIYAALETAFITSLLSGVGNETENEFSFILILSFWI